MRVIFVVSFVAVPGVPADVCGRREELPLSRLVATQ
jgi:hypothetical protein